MISWIPTIITAGILLVALASFHRVHLHCARPVYVRQRECKLRGSFWDRRSANFSVNLIMMNSGPIDVALLDLKLEILREVRPQGTTRVTHTDGSVEVFPDVVPRYGMKSHRVSFGIEDRTIRVGEWLQVRESAEIVWARKRLLRRGRICKEIGKYWIQVPCWAHADIGLTLPIRAKPKRCSKFSVPPKCENRDLCQYAMFANKQRSTEWSDLACQGKADGAG